MAWHLIVAVANPVASFRADRQPITDPRPAPGFVPRFKLLPCWAGSPLRNACESFSTFLSQLFQRARFFPPVIVSNTARSPSSSRICIGRETTGTTVMAVRFTILVLLTTVVVVVSSAGLLETLLSWDFPDAVGRSTNPQSQCLCQTSNCLCCIDLNLTATFDLGGPACINVRQKEQNVSLNLSYGDNPVHNATIKIVDAANRSTCMNLLSDLAQICAKFTWIKQTEAGHDGCLVIEPALLGTPQATYQMGCFNFNQAVRQIEAPPSIETAEAGESGEEEEDSLNTEEFIAAVSASAEQGIALFSQWLGLNLNPKLNVTSGKNGQQEASGQRSTTSRSARARWDQEEKSDERFKQLLSAQDNVLRGSATIGQSSGAETTFVYSKPPGLYSSDKSSSDERRVDRMKIEPQHLAVVPKESRRGGRAYNIHQHVNEI